MRIFTIFLVIVSASAWGKDCECLSNPKSQAEFCAVYDKAAIGTFRIVAADSRVAKLHFFPTEVLRGELEGPLELFAEKDECAFWAREGQEFYVLLSGNSKRLSGCNAGRSRAEMIHMPYVYNLANCLPNRDA